MLHGEAPYGPEESEVTCGQEFKIPVLDGPIAPLYVHFERFPSERDIKTLNQKVMTTCRLPITIEYSLPNWPLVDYKKLVATEIKTISALPFLSRN
jgi:hypothetical protein